MLSVIETTIKYLLINLFFIKFKLILLENTLL